MSVEIIEDIICVNDGFAFQLLPEKDLATINFYESEDDKNWAGLNKVELSQLITALQAMHDRMVD